jgi:hypothetical protein
MSLATRLHSARSSRFVLCRDFALRRDRTASRSRNVDGENSDKVVEFAAGAYRSCRTCLLGFRSATRPDAVGRYVFWPCCYASSDDLYRAPRSLRHRAIP